MLNLSICSKEIRLFNNLYSLNDLHQAAGGANNHRPSLFVRTEQTKLLINEIEQSTDMCLALKKVHGGKERGTYACKELVYAYAMWINPKFHLHVIRAFDETQIKELSEPKRPQVSDTERYALVNAMIENLNLDGSPVLIPHIELVNIISMLRNYQQTIDRLGEMRERVDSGIATFMRAGNRHFGQY